MTREPRAKALFVVKILTWDGTGVVLWYSGSSLVPSGPLEAPKLSAEMGVVRA